MDETYVKVKGVGKYLYRAVDSNGNTLDFLLTVRRDGKAAKRFLRKMLLVLADFVESSKALRNRAFKDLGSVSET